MKIKAIYKGKEIEVEILDEDLETLTKRKTGYERVSPGEKYYVYKGYLNTFIDVGDISDDDAYRFANYYNDKKLAENNIRADNLMRQLRRFSAEHRSKNSNPFSYTIKYDLVNKSIHPVWNGTSKIIGVCFDNVNHAQEAINKYYDELLWYFTEYTDCLE